MPEVRDIGRRRTFSPQSRPVVGQHRHARVIRSWCFLADGQATLTALPGFTALPLGGERKVTNTTDEGSSRFERCIVALDPRIWFDIDLDACYFMWWYSLGENVPCAKNNTLSRPNSHWRFPSNDRPQYVHHANLSRSTPNNYSTFDSILNL